MSTDRDAVQSLVVELQEGKLLLPNVAVAEVVPQAEVAWAEGDPDWLVGSLQWRGLALPVVALERYQGATFHVPGGPVTVLVMNTLSGRMSPGFYALVVAAPPRLERVVEGALTPAGDGIPGAGLTLDYQGQRVLLPDLSALERHLLGSRDSAA